MPDLRAEPADSSRRRAGSRGHRRARSRLLSGSMLACLLLATQTTEPARADGGKGGSTGVDGGIDNQTGVGGSGERTLNGGGGGGGAGRSGGSGGSGRVSGGLGGASAINGIGGNGLVGTSTTGVGGGGGGGGGAHGFVGVGAPLIATTGGNGGNGGSATAAGGGGGGAGGYGAVLTGSSGAVGFAVTGGNGGNGGASNTSTNVGGGGSGGVGVLFTAPGSFDIDTTVNGGRGGTGISFGRNGNGAGGVGVVAAGSVSLVLGSGADITGGLSGDGVRANAVSLTGAVNRLELRSGARLTGNVVASGTSALALGGTAAGTFDIATIGSAAQFRGFTSFVKDGTSIWTLTGTGSFAGAGVVDAGTLAVNGNVSSFSSLTVNAGGTLGGSGTVGATTIAGGTLAPGNSIGTLAVAGNLGFTASAIYAVEVSPTAADRVDVTGVATLGGAAVNAIFANGSYVARQYTILTATGGVSGTFGTLTNTNLPAAFKSGLSYDANTAFLNLSLDFTPPTTPTTTTTTPAAQPAPTTGSTPTPEPAATSVAATPAPAPNRNLNPNQTSTANALTAYFNTNGSIPIVYGALTPETLSQAAGEPATGTQQNSFDAMTQFTGAIMPTSLDGRGTPIAPGPSGYAAYSSSSGKADALPAKTLPGVDPDAWRWSVWGSGFGARQSHAGQASQGVAASANSVYGLAAGADYRLSPSTVAGFALAGGATDFSTRGLGTGRSDLVQAGVFIRHHIGQAYVAAAAAYGWQDVTSDRSVAGVDRLESRFDVHSLSGRIEGGYRFAAPVLGQALGLTPFAAAQFTVSALPGYSERVVSGPGLFSLTYAGRDAVSRRGELGLRADTTFALADVALTLSGGLAWAYHFDSERATATASFQALPGASFVVSGASQDRNALRSTAAAELKWKNGLALAAAFEGEFSQRSTSYGGKAVLRYTW